jgi:ketosteroid isomerase-like protein
MSHDESSPEEGAICDLLDRFASGMKTLDLETVADLWDASFEHVVYQPEEYPRACTTWDEITAYWSQIPTVVEQITRWTRLAVDVAVLGDAALVYAVFDTAFIIRGLTEPLAGEVRFTLGLRHTGDGWRFVHAHESRQLVVE